MWTLFPPSGEEQNCTSDDGSWDGWRWFHLLNKSNVNLSLALMSLFNCNLKYFDRHEGTGRFNQTFV